MIAGQSRIWHHRTKARGAKTTRATRWKRANPTPHESALEEEAHAHRQSRGDAGVRIFIAQARRPALRLHVLVGGTMIALTEDLTKAFLRDRGLPVPAGEAADSAESALDNAVTIVSRVCVLPAPLGLALPPSSMNLPTMFRLSGPL